MKKSAFAVFLCCMLTLSALSASQVYAAPAGTLNGETPRTVENNLKKHHRLDNKKYRQRNRKKQRGHGDFNSLNN